VRVISDHPSLRTLAFRDIGRGRNRNQQRAVFAQAVSQMLSVNRRVEAMSFDYLYVR
jgi:hypothetical protein